MENLDKFILETALKKISLAFDDFVDECVDESGQAITPSGRAVAQARACLPEYCKNAFKKMTKLK